ncbi:hypothetical protein IWX49DRAFT_56746 [Phyllosticta citricarpa]|uniref:Uncharacterized protein n=1 Tax=Phyllosticta citricarpa TaxID=55181 RepID=A0ABR1MR73_9PEZI
MHPLLLILHLLLVINGHTYCAAVDLFGLPFYDTAPAIIDRAFQPFLILGFVAMELQGALLSDEHQFRSVAMAAPLSYFTILTFLITNYAVGFFWSSCVDLLVQLEDNFIRSMTLAVAFAIPCIENMASLTLDQIKRLPNYKRTILSTSIILALAFACSNVVATHAADIFLYSLIFANVSAFVIFALVLTAGVVRCFFIFTSYITMKCLEKIVVSSKTQHHLSKRQRNSHVPHCHPPMSSGLTFSSLDDCCRACGSCPSTVQSTSIKSPVLSTERTENQTRARVSSHFSSSSSKSSKPSGPSSASSQPSRPSTRTSVFDVDHGHCQNRITVLQMALDILASENIKLASEKAELSNETAHLKTKNEFLRHQAFQAEGNFEEHLESLKFLETANAQLLQELQNQRRINSEKDAEFDSRIEEFIQNVYPEYSEVTSSSVPSTSSVTSTPSSSSETLVTPNNSHGAVKSVAKYNISLLKRCKTSSPAIVSSGSSLPFSPFSPATPARSFGHVSPNSLAKRFKDCNPNGPGLPTPGPRTRLADPSKFVTSAELVTPKTVSSGCSLPFSLEASTERSGFISPTDVTVPFRARVGAGCDLPSLGVLGPIFSTAGPKRSPLKLPTTPLDSSPLPCPSVVTVSDCFADFSVNSAVKPSCSHHTGHNSFESPLAGYTANGNHSSSMCISGFTTPKDIIRPQRFSNFLDFEDSPATVSSSSTLPIPSPSNTTSSSDPFI